MMGSMKGSDVLMMVEWRVNNGVMMTEGLTNWWLMWIEKGCFDSPIMIWWLFYWRLNDGNWLLHGYQMMVHQWSMVVSSKVCNQHFGYNTSNMWVSIPEISGVIKHHHFGIDFGTPALADMPTHTWDIASRKQSSGNILLLLLRVHVDGPCTIHIYGSGGPPAIKWTAVETVVVNGESGSFERVASRESNHGILLQGFYPCESL